MSGKQPRSSTSSSAQSPPHNSKLPKFLQRDRSRSLVDPTASASSSPGSSSSSSSNQVSESAKTSRKIVKKGLSRDREERRRQSQDADSFEQPNGGEEHADAEPPVIVEPVNIPRPRTRSERPLSDNYPSVAFYPSNSSTSRLTDLPTRLSGWFSHTFSTSSTDLSLPSLISQQHLASSTSPKGKSSAILTAARHGKGHLDKAMRYLLDSDATPDKCADPIWLLGVEHPGYEPPPPPSAANSPGAVATLGRRSSVSDSRRSPSSFRSSTSSSPVTPNSPVDPSLSQSQPASSANPKDPARNWPPVFYSDFTSRIWVTYRSQFQPIRDTTLSALELELGESTAVATSPQPKKWNWPLGGEKGWTSDAGWGCMLRTGQSLLANTLLHLHLGRDWRRPPYPICTADYATYVQILTWFFDNPSPLCPFSVHRMALVGKELGKEVGQWFGPSTAAGAIKTLVHAFPEAGLGVSVATDSVIYQSDVYTASRSNLGSPRRNGRSGWGDRAVLVLVGIRLGLDGVNPIYYDTIKALYTFPQSVGIAGGRPSSSYYFVGSQADNLFYLDPHHARPTIPLRPPPPAGTESPPGQYENLSTPERPSRAAFHARSPTSPSSLRSGAGSSSSTFSHRSPVAPSPLQQTFSSSSASTNNSSQAHMRWQSSSVLPDNSEMDSRELDFCADLDPVQRHYATAYSTTELRTFHCERIRKMPLSGLDPSMLIGFLCKDEEDWLDLRKRITDLSRTHKTIFSIQDEPPNWPSDSDDNMGLESISEPDIDMPEDEDEDRSSFGPERSASASPDTSVSVQGAAAKSDTEEDPVGPLTPSAGKTSFDQDTFEHIGKAPELEGVGDEDDDSDDEEWVDSEMYTPPMSPEEFEDAQLLPEPEEPVPAVADRIPPSLTPPPAIAQALSTNSTASGSSRRKKKRTPKAVPLRVSASHPPEQYPFPATDTEDMLPQPRPSAEGKRVPQMRTAKARDGGRTQSGGVRAVLTQDADDF
ncbi:ATG4-like protein [Gelatoporia subvermispora B]|uniref:Cysteine protease n=1 Tax=Ceriporiopsis subvermispora (strain B) TaxID=914234 RepID=M2PZJ9_CERS8|nr:ATG4-like protein [Gelatoporia subvermispora B]